LVSPNLDDKIRNEKVGEACGTHEEQNILCTVLVRTPEIRRALGRPSVYGRMILK
jgi:hypothetical protein